ncbi:16S rRNA (guanine(527)-N(7))-methyltransferase RsmG [Candidatus Dependentiae bacterium]|nr:16S rRNA (guanine(527)-N(7))-methyltransferase RsmG [Candidatus Dependentiae bacterium]
MKYKQKDPALVWAQFQESEQLTDEQLAQFQQYETYLSGQNELFNLTAITELSGIVRNHFQDSIMLRKFVDFNAISTICDVGAGAGFPSIPLKIMFPHLKVILIEVTRKKREFLKDVTELMGLQDVEICADDWRTFIRTTEHPIDLFVTRAALDELELVRVFKPASPYRNVPMVYWASNEWEVHPRAAEFLKKTEIYKIGQKTRKFAFMGV